MTKGNINVSVENIFPLIKKFLYSDHEIFLRELISNATDATLKLKHLTSIGDAKTEYGNPKIEVKIDKSGKKLHIIDQGLGMTAEEVEKYINQIAFSGAEEFLDKYKDSGKDTGIIGHFGLGFYSAFMVAEKVEIITKSFKDEPAAHWTCDGSPEFSLKKGKKTERGTEIILHIAEDSTEFLEESRISELLHKYNKFMPIPIKFGTKEVNVALPEDAPKDAKPEKKTIDNIINNPNPAWTKQPADLEDEDYKSFYKELYPMQFEEPLFHIHLNVDYPFNLTGILYFPKMTNDLNIQKDKIQLYQNQVYVGAIDIRNQCSGFLYALSVADQFIKTGMYKNILVIGAEYHSNGLDKSTRGRGVTVIFGDGAGACVLSREVDTTKGILSTHLHSEGKYADKLIVKSPSIRHWIPQILESKEEDLSYFPYMDGTFVFKHAVVRFSEVIMEGLIKNGLQKEDIDMLIPHQANLRIAQFIQKKFGLSDDQVFNNIMKYGNTTAASVIIALTEAWEKGKINEGDTVVLAAFGSGFTWASAIIKW